VVLAANRITPHGVGDPEPGQILEDRDEARMVEVAAASHPGSPEPQPKSVRFRLCPRPIDVHDGLRDFAPFNGAGCG
jgi:hypothetical protein